MKLFLQDIQGQIVVENVLIIALLVVVVMVSAPPLQKTIIRLYGSLTHQLSGETISFSREISDNRRWVPPELASDDNKVVYCQGNISLTDGARINGNVLSNGIIKLGVGSNIEYGIVEKQANYSFNFPLPDFPIYPYGSLPAKGTLYVEDQSATTVLNDNGYYEQLTVANSVIINTGNPGNVREIIVDNLDLGSTGKISLQGEGILKLYVRNTINFQGNAAINGDGSPESLIMYYQGKEPINFGGGSQVFRGSLYTEKSDFTILGGTSSIQGNIIVGGLVARIIDSSESLTNSLLYAPGSELILSNSMIQGKIVVGSITGAGESTIEYQSVRLDDAFTWSP